MDSPDIIKTLYRQLSDYTGKPLKFYTVEDIPATEISMPEIVQNPKVSVAMLCYNHAPYLGEAIANVVDQQCDFPFELVIAEDCSQDDSRAVICDWQRRHPDKIRMIYSEKNVGMVANNMRLIAHCRGKYVAFCEGDDVWNDPHKLAIQYSTMELHPEASLVFSRSDVISGNQLKRNEIMFSGFPPRRPVWQEILNWRYFIHTATAMGKNHPLQEIIRTDPEIRCNLAPAADTMLFLGLALRGDVAFINRNLSTYRILAASASHHLTMAQNWNYQCRLMVFQMILTERYRKEKKYHSDASQNSWKGCLKNIFKAMIKRHDLSILPQIDQFCDQLQLTLPSELRMVRSWMIRDQVVLCKIWLCKEKMLATRSILLQLCQRTSAWIAPSIQIHRLECKDTS